MSPKFAIIAGFAAASLLLVGCDADTSSGSSANKPPIVEAPKLVLPSITETVRFDGTTSRVETLETPLEAYKVTLTLVSEEGNGSSDYSTTTPPMPARIGRLGILHVSDTSYRVAFSNESSNVGAFGKPLEPTTITVIGTPDGAAVAVDGRTIIKTATPTPLQTLTLGSGFQERYWTGDIQMMEICEISKTTSLDDAATASCL